MIPKIGKGHITLNIVYISDVHNNIKNVRHFKTAMDEFRRIHPNTIELANGDLNIASDLEPNILMLKAMDLSGVDVSTVANHELEGGDFWAKAVELAKTKIKFLSANLHFSRPNQLEHKIAKSTIIERGGERFGVIAISPLDSEELIHRADFNNYFNVQDFDSTVISIRQEVAELEKLGINKIFLMAHTGKKSKKGFHYYKNLTKIGGIDVIVGGHDHKKYSRWFTSERGEPVKVVSVEAANDVNKLSEDLGTFGLLRAVFDGNGVLIPKKCKNKIQKTKNYPPSLKIKALEDKILQNNEIICYSNQSLECKQRKTQENPVANLLADSMFWLVKKINPDSKAQIALINSGEIKADIRKGKISIKDIKNAFQFTHQVIMVEAIFTKKQLFEALNWGVETTRFSKQTLGLLQVGGLRYTVGSNKKIKDVYLIGKDGKLGECLDKMSDNKEYTVLYDTYLMNGVGGMSSLKKDPKDPNIKIYPYNHQSGIIEYLREVFKDKPVEVRMGRIQVESEIGERFV